MFSAAQLNIAADSRKSCAPYLVGIECSFGALTHDCIDVSARAGTLVAEPAEFISAGNAGTAARSKSCRPGGSTFHN